MANQNNYKFEKKNRLPSLFSTELGKYPVQGKGQPDSRFGGEFRGFYRSKIGGKWIDRWFPKQSQHDGRGTKANNHNGIDVYAAYFPYPLETPILSVTDGWFSPKEDRQFPNKIGNRAIVTTKVSGKEVSLYYGHLARFEGRARKVAKGDVIGYAGCSGNADTAGECSELFGCKITSCHVHLVAAFGATGNKLNDVNPVPLLQWSLGHGDTNTATKCSDWMPQHGRDVPPEKEGETGKLIARSNVEWRRSKKGKRRQLKKPFDDIEFDSTKSIRRTLAAYKVVYNPGDKPEGRFISKEFLSAAADEYRSSRICVHAILQDLELEIESFNPDTGEKSRIPPGGPIARAHLLARLALWHLMGGSALSWAISNRREGTKSVSFFECGVGVGGEAQLIAVDGGRCALHRTTMNIEDVLSQVWSVTFGAGSMMHATWKRAVASGLGASTTIFGVLVEMAAIAMWNAMTRTLKYAERLSGAGEPDYEKLQQTVTDLNLVLAWLNSANGVLKDIEQENLEKLLKQLVADNIEVFEAAKKKSVVKESATPIGPQLSTMYVEPTKETTS